MTAEIKSLSLIQEDEHIALDSAILFFKRFPTQLEFEKTPDNQKRFRSAVEILCKNSEEGFSQRLFALFRILNIKSRKWTKVDARWNTEYDFLWEHLIEFLPVIDRYLASINKSKKEKSEEDRIHDRCFQLLFRILTHANSSQLHYACVDILTRFSHQVTAQIKPPTQSFFHRAKQTGFTPPQNWVSQALNYIAYLDSSRSNKVHHVVNEIIRNPATENKVIAQLFGYGQGNLRAKEAARQYLSSKLNRIGIEDSDLLEEWYDSAGKGQQNISSLIELSLSAFDTLADINPKAPAALYDEFHLANFGRYPIPAMEAMYIDSLGSPTLQNYVTVINPLFDEDGAFYTDKEVYENLFLELKKLGFGLKIVECDGLRHVIRSCIQLFRQYGPTSGVIVGGHGAVDEIVLGRQKYGGRINMRELFQTLRGAIISKYNNRFILPGSDVIFNSCLVGRPHAIAQNTSDQYNVRTTGPYKSTYIESITPYMRHDKLRLRADYAQSKKGVYVSGKHVRPRS